ncbi:PREDICTED: protein O-mannose kinase-like [Priapulus caudatus]|uniref:Protein O-mannose kinase-like n=1 Tax=Priapulus caudatus TaxID=37621 RepID=A0ABM1EMP8_PRICU|nr:PREDICTED: protein O-mannose kinase-like [Priapulus caudatus]
MAPHCRALTELSRCLKSRYVVTICLFGCFLVYTGHKLDVITVVVRNESAGLLTREVLSSLNASLSTAKAKHQSLQACVRSGGTLENQPCCEHGQFALQGMHVCRKWLNCQELSELEVEKFGQPRRGYKKIYLTTFKEHKIVLMQLPVDENKVTFKQALANYQWLQPNPLVVQLIGVCEITQEFAVEYYELGDARNAEQHIQSLSQEQADERQLLLCMDYAAINLMLHEKGRCNPDQNTLVKTLSQYLLSDDMRLLLSDMDILSEIGVEPTLLNNTHDAHLIAPEHDVVASLSCKSSTNSSCVKALAARQVKLDVWKIPAVCDRMLPRNSNLMRRLADIHAKCKIVDPIQRMSMEDVLLGYSRVFISMYGEQQFLQKTQRYKGILAYDRIEIEINTHHRIVDDIRSV